MNAKRKREKIKGRKESGRFVGLPFCVLKCDDYIGLSYKSKALLIDLALQYNGSNNGNLLRSLGGANGVRQLQGEPIFS